jgi:hypothetical protein
LENYRVAGLIVVTPRRDIDLLTVAAWREAALAFGGEGVLGRLKFSLGILYSSRPTSSPALTRDHSNKELYHFEK